MIATGCVSSTLDSKQFRPVGGSTESTGSDNFDREPTQEIAQSPTGPVNLANPASESAAIAADKTLKTGNGETGSGQNSVLNPVEREKAIAEMRAKAANGSGVKTRIGLLPESSSDPMDAGKQKRLAAELEKSIEEAEKSATDEELEAKKNSIEAMRRKAGSHYDNALKRIED